MDSTEEFFLFRINRLAAIAGRPLTRLCEGRFGITRREWRLIVVLARGGPLTSTELAKRAYLETPRTSRSVTILVEKKLAQRLPRPNDRRYIEIHLTDAGREIYESLYPTVEKLNAHLLSGIGAEDRVVLERLWDRLEKSALHLTDAIPDLPKANRRRK